MRKRPLTTLLAATAATVAIGALSATPALARGGPGPGGGGGGGGGRPCGATTATSGSGSLGSPFSLSGKYDDNDAQPGVVIVEEEFQVNTQVANQVWNVTFTDNGTTFFSGSVTSTTAGVHASASTTYAGGTSALTVAAVNQTTGETVNSTITAPAAPSACGHR